MLKKLFGRKDKEEKKYGPTEPIFPGELFAVSEITDENGFFGISNVNQSYIDYPNKKYFPWCAQLLLEFEDKNENGLPTDEEALILNELEDKIENFLNIKHKVHFIGRVTRKDFRDLLYYIDHPRFTQEETDQFFDEINSVRGVNFSLEKDPEWEFVAGLLK